MSSKETSKAQIIATLQRLANEPLPSMEDWAKPWREFSEALEASPFPASMDLVVTTATVRVLFAASSEDLLRHTSMTLSAAGLGAVLTGPALKGPIRVESPEELWTLISSLPDWLKTTLLEVRCPPLPS